MRVIALAVVLATAVLVRVVGQAQPPDADADVSVERLTKFDLVIAFNTAQALRLTIPRTLLLRADRVIE